MRESIPKRVSRLISGGFSKLADAMENTVPEMVMEETIYEIDDAIGEVRSELGREIANKNLASKRLMEANKKHEDLSEKMEIALRENRDELAEAAIAKQLNIEAQMPIFESSIHEGAEREKELEGYIQALLAKKRELKEELEVFKKSRARTSIEAQQLKAGGISGNPAQGKADRADAAFHRVLERQTGIDAVREGVDPKTAAQLVELEELALKNRIKERLASVKGRVMGEET